MSKFTQEGTALDYKIARCGTGTKTNLKADLVKASPLFQDMTKKADTCVVSEI